MAPRVRAAQERHKMHREAGSEATEPHCEQHRLRASMVTRNNVCECLVHTLQHVMWRPTAHGVCPWQSTPMTQTVSTQMEWRSMERHSDGTSVCYVHKQRARSMSIPGTGDARQHSCKA